MSLKVTTDRTMDTLTILKMKELRSLQITPPEDWDTVYTVVINNIEFDYYKDTWVLSRISKDEVMNDKQLEENVDKEKNELNPMEAELDSMKKSLEYLINNNKAGKNKKNIAELEKNIADKKIEIACKKKEIGDNIKELWKRNNFKIIINEEDIIKEVEKIITENSL